MYAQINGIGKNTASSCVHKMEEMSQRGRERERREKKKRTERKMYENGNALSGFRNARTNEKSLSVGSL